MHGGYVRHVFGARVMTPKSSGKGTSTRPQEAALTKHVSTLRRQSLVFSSSKSGRGTRVSIVDMSTACSIAWACSHENAGTWSGVDTGVSIISIIRCSAIALSSACPMAGACDKIQCKCPSMWASGNEGVSAVLFDWSVLDESSPLCECHSNVPLPVSQLGLPI